MIIDKDVSAFLEHHGIKGQRWGVRRERNSSGRAGGDEAAILAVYGGIAIGTLAFTAVKQGHESGAYHSAIIRGKAFCQGKKGLPFKVNPELSKSMSHGNIMKKVVAPINSGYGKPGTKMNCRRCTFSYEMRRRGFDVAATHTSNATGGSNKQLFKATHPNKGESFKDFANTSRWGANHSTPDHIFSDLAKQPSGARGDLTFGWRGGGAHSVAWENFNGKPVIIDCQRGKSYSNVKQFKSDPDFAHQHVDDMAFTRLDNISLNHKNLTRWLKDA